VTKSKSYIEERLTDEINSFLSEPAMSKYHVDTPNIFSFSDFLSNKMLVINTIREGIPYSIFNAIQEYTPFSEKDWANFLDISRKSLQRYKVSGDHHFKSIHTEKIIEIAEVTQLGLDVFGNLGKLKLWLNTPSYALGNLKPIDLLQDSYGKELVMSELININHGILV
jgi:putative toxin-antitoxin system antitoxin component (TIGR02293 family)